MPDGARRSLWALPSGPDRAGLAAVIDALARLSGTDGFEPHITIVGSVPGPHEAAGAIDRLAATTGPFTVELPELVDTDEHFRCIVANVRLDGPLARLHHDACAAFGTATEGFEPHVSLVYGDLPPDERARLREHVDLALPGHVRIDAISLVDTEGVDTRDWSTLATWPLRGA